MNLSPRDLILAVAALWRVTSLFVNEAGPGDVFEQVREVAGIRHEGHVKVDIPDEPAARLLDCMWCLSQVLAFPFVALWFVNANLARWVSLPFALSAGVIALSKLLRYEE